MKVIRSLISPQSREYELVPDSIRTLFRLKRTSFSARIPLSITRLDGYWMRRKKVLPMPRFSTLPTMECFLVLIGWKIRGQPCMTNSQGSHLL